MQGLVAGKSALVTGGASGIGRATCLALAREGARVAVADQSEEGAAATVAEINRAGGQAIGIALDVTDPAKVEAMMRTTVAAFGRIDCAFNNAGISGVNVDAAGMKTAEWSEQAFDRMIEVNLKSVWLCMKQEILLMLQQGGGGAIVNTASVLGLVGGPFSSAYVAAKHGVVGLTKSAAIEYAEDGIRVNAVCPGYITTPMTEDVMRRRGDQILAKVPARRMGEPEEIAEMVVWLCSDRASFVTGAAYNVDGGYVAA
ncbi:MAG: glucose 1-dehydrogenase [Proteobacteria bacterium]|nr:glucose 1-dehydrogenase [Pseudomonadota bacterium]